MEELLKEDEESSEPEHLKAMRRANTSTTAQSGAKSKMGGKFAGKSEVPERVDPKKGSPHLQYRSGSSPRRTPRRR